MVNSLIDGLTSTMYYGADRTVGAVSNGIRGRRSSQQKIADNESGSNTVNLKDVNFMQSSIKNQTGEYTVLGNAGALKSGALKATDLPEIRIWQDADGKLWTLDHRRLASFRIAELDNVPCRWATDAEVANQMWKKYDSTIER